MAYATSRRMQEFGIRIALGATRAGVCAMVLRESFALVVAGLAVGIPLALASGRGIRRALRRWRSGCLRNGHRIICPDDSRHRRRPRSGDQGIACSPGRRSAPRLISPRSVSTPC